MRHRKPSSPRRAPAVSEPTGPYIVKMHEAKSSLSRLVRMVEDGRRVMIARADTTVVEIIPVRVTPPPGRPRQFGALRGVVSVGPEFFEPLPVDELGAWE